MDHAKPGPLGLQLLIMEVKVIVKVVETTDGVAEELAVQAVRFVALIV